MPISAPERFARTYTPRIPDDSYDSLGGGDVPDSLVSAPFQKPFERIVVTSSFTNGMIAQTLVPSGQTTRINITANFSSGALQTSAIKGPVQHDTITLTTAMAGGTLQ